MVLHCRPSTSPCIRADLPTGSKYDFLRFTGTSTANNGAAFYTNANVRDHDSACVRQFIIPIIPLNRL